MKVRILEPIAGNADERYGLADFSFRPGEEVELHDDLAAAWIEAGRAAAVEEAEEAPAAPQQHHAKKQRRG
jgi:hypothetical protein